MTAAIDTNELTSRRRAMIRAAATGQPVDLAEVAALDEQIAAAARHADIARDVARAKEQITREQYQAAQRAEFERLETVTAEALQHVKDCAMRADRAVQDAQALVEAWRNAEGELHAAQQEAGAVAGTIGRRATEYLTGFSRIEVALMMNIGGEHQRRLAELPRPAKV